MLVRTSLKRRHRTNRSGGLFATQPLPELGAAWRRRRAFWSMPTLLCLTGAASALDIPNLSTAVAPDSENSFKPFVAFQETYNANLYQLPAGPLYFDALVGSGQPRDDYLSTASAGTDGTWTFGRQVVAFTARVDDNRFSHYKDLDNVDGLGKVQLNWEIGNQLSGQAAYTYTRTLAAFADTRYFARDMVETNQILGELRYQLGPKWSTYGSVLQTHTSNSAAPERINDAETSVYTGGIEFATAVNNTVSWEYDRTVGRYPSDIVLDDVTIDRDYVENSIHFLTTYNFTDKTSLNANLGYLKRDYPDSRFGTFSGDTWRVTLQWAPTAKLQFAFATWHELQAFLDSQSNYFIAKGGSVSPVWSISSKVSLTALASYAVQDYINSSLNDLIVGARRDKVASGQLAFDYAATRALDLKLAYKYDKRDSNQATFTYDDSAVTLSFKFTF